MTTAVTLITPTTLTLTQHLNNYHSKDASGNTDHIVTASQDFMNKQWLNQKGKTENLDNFKHPKDKDHPQGNKIIPAGGHVNNDYVNDDWDCKPVIGWQPGKDGTNDGNGAPYVRFGGDLFLDGSTYSSDGQQKLNAKGLKNDVVSTSNFVSTNPKKPSDVPANLPDLANNKRNASDINPQNNWANLDTNKYDEYEDAFTQYYQTQSSDFSKTQAKTDPNDKIVNKEDLNYTPDYIPGTQKTTSTSTTGKPSKTKAIFTQLFNYELKDWYWKTWGSEAARTAVDPSIVNKKIDSATKRDDNLTTSGLLKAPKLNLSASFNQLVSQKVDEPWYDKIIGEGGAEATGILVGALFDAFDAGLFGIGPLTSFAVDAFLPDSYTVYSTIQRLLPYQSVSLDEAVWDNFFDQYLGTPDNKYKGLIQKYYQTHDSYPADVNLNNFDIYSPFSNIDINSIFNYDYWKNDLDVPTENRNASDSNSTIDLSKLNVELAADIQFSDNTGPDASQLIYGLQNDKEIWDIGPINPNSSKPSDPYNSQLILGALAGSKYEPLTGQITFPNNNDVLKPGVSVPIHWSYSGFPEGCINVEA